METIEVHSKDFVIRWVEVRSPSRVTWKTLPLKRSINFGVFSHDNERDSGHSFEHATGSLSERLDAAGFQSVTPGGLSRIESREPAEGSASIGRRVLLAFVFDNTFSISNSKHVQFSFNLEPLSPALGASAATNGAREDAGVGSTAPVNAGTAAAAAAANAALYHKSNEQAVAPSSPSLAPFPQLQQSSSQSQPHANGHAGDAAQVSSPPSTLSSRKLSFSRARSGEPGASGRSKSVTRRGTLPSHNMNCGSSSSAIQEDTDSTSIRKLRSRPNTFNSISSASDGEVMKSLDGRFVNGFLQKKRRKQFQGFARRYFSLDKQTGLLNYYLSNRSSILRGVMPIRIAEMKVDNQNLQLTLNSGMEKWTLKTNDPKTFSSWCTELKQVRSAGAQDESEVEDDDATGSSVGRTESISSQLSGDVSSATILDDTSLPKPEPLTSDIPSLSHLRSSILSLSNTQVRKELQSIYLSIIKEIPKAGAARKSRASDGTSNRRQSVAKPPNSSRPPAKSRLSQATIIPLIRQRTKLSALDHMIDQLRSRNFLGIGIISMLLGLFLGLAYTFTLLTTLIVAAAGGFVQFKAPSDRHASGFDSSEKDAYAEAYSNAGIQYNYPNQSNPSLVSTSTSGVSGAPSGGSDEDDEADDFSDASDEDDGASTASVAFVPQVPSYTMPTQQRTPNMSIAGSGESTPTRSTFSPDNADAADDTMAASSMDALWEESQKSAETSLYPLPHAEVHRRENVNSPVQNPPSLLAILKKAKDPANMTAPITSNEPLSGVEQVAEMYENSDLLDAASEAPPKSHARVALVATFAVARLSGTRVKERTLRKPFTPLLGETYEMVREDRGFRFLAEKVTHKPEAIATQAESPLWTAHFTSRPHTKMWAKSIQLTDVGHFSVTFPDGESVSFINPEMFIRNILAGERYVEPSGTVTVESNAGSHLTANIEFKAGGMFSGRSEDVKITCGKLVYEGKWTEAIYEGSKPIWTAKPLVDNAAKHYGWTKFAAQLNEITPIEGGHLPPNDSRMRPDLRLYEDQSDIEKAEELKLSLEQHQRERRKDMETAGKQHEPFFFVKSKDSKGHYILRHGERNYWVLRQEQDWQSIPNYFE